MTNEQAIQTIQARVEELTQDQKVQEKMMNKKQQGQTTEAIQEWVIQLAIATLVGA